MRHEIFRRRKLFFCLLGLALLLLVLVELLVPWRFYLYRGSPLRQAVLRGDSASVERLLQGGADPNEIDKYGWNLLFYAAKCNHASVARILIGAGADKDSVCWGWTPLTIASYEGHIEMVRLLISVGADVNIDTGGGWTPLKYAEYAGHPSIVEILEAAGAMPSDSRQ